MPSVPETSVAPPPVGTWEETGVVSAAELMGGEVLASLRPGLVEDAGSVSDQVVSEEPGTGAEPLLSLVTEGVATGEVTSGGADSPGTEEGASCPDLVVPTLVSAVCPER